MGAPPEGGGHGNPRDVELFPDLADFADPADSTDQHATFADRAARVEGKLLCLNFRRLPAWALSRAQQVAVRGLAPDFRPSAMQSPHELSRSGLPDQRLGLYYDHEISHWFTAAQLRDMYRHNPGWTGLEQRLYGALLIDA